MKKIIITAGGTSEQIDSVRKITNSSTGKLGSIIANAFLTNKAENIEKIYYICGKNSVLPIKNAKIEICEITDVKSLEQIVRQILTREHIDIFIHSMAVSDYTVDYVSSAKLLAQNIFNNSNASITQEKIENSIISNSLKFENNTKISSSENDLIIKLKPTPKIISLIKVLSPQTFLVGFKLLSGVSESELVTTATNLLKKNNCNLVVANDLSEISHEKHKAIIIDEKGNQTVIYTKEEIANELIKII